MTLRARMLHRRTYSTPTRHGDFYASLLPAMIPIALLGSAVYLGLHLVQSRLAHEKFLDQANERIRALEEELDSLQRQRSPVPLISTPKRAPSSQEGSRWSWF